MKTSYKKAFEFNQAANYFLDNFKEDTKLKAALEDVSDQIPPFIEEFNKLKIKKQRKYCSVDPISKHILRDDKNGYKYTTEKEEELEDEMDGIFNNEESVYVKHEYVNEEDLPKDLHRLYKKIFTGFVIKPKTEE